MAEQGARGPGSLGRAEFHSACPHRPHVRLPGQEVFPATQTRCEAWEAWCPSPCRRGLWADSVLPCTAGTKASSRVRNPRQDSHTDLSAAPPGRSPAPCPMCCEDTFKGFRLDDPGQVSPHLRTRSHPLGRECEEPGDSVEPRRADASGAGGGPRGRHAALGPAGTGLGSSLRTLQLQVN